MSGTASISRRLSTNPKETPIVTTRTGPDQAIRPKMTVKWAKSKALFRRGRVIAMRVFWAVVFAFIAIVLTQKVWDGHPGMLIVIIAGGAAFGAWVGGGSGAQSEE